MTTRWLDGRPSWQRWTLIAVVAVAGAVVLGLTSSVRLGTIFGLTFFLGMALATYAGERRGREPQ